MTDQDFTPEELILLTSAVIKQMQASRLDAKRAEVNGASEAGREATALAERHKSLWRKLVAIQTREP